MIQKMFVAFFALNAIFWGLFDHATHCNVARRFGIRTCPPHMLHIIFGMMFFVLAVVTAQWRYIFRA